MRINDEQIAHENKVYDFVELSKVPGKTVLDIAHGRQDSAWGEEPSTIVFFTDGTYHEFVHPRDDDF